MRTRRVGVGVLAAAAAAALAAGVWRAGPGLAGGTCPVTVPNGSTPPGWVPSPNDHGNGALWVVLPPDGTVLIAPERLGSQGFKLPWWRGVEGELALDVRRLDGPAPAAAVDIPAGYGSTGMQPSLVVFPSVGCWQITAVAGEARLTVVVRVALEETPDWRALHRPLHLPALRSGRCPVSRPASGITPERTGVGGAIGPGPVYPLLGRSVLDTHFRPAQWGRTVWGGQKVLWFVHQRYRGPVLIRGRRLGGRQWLRFDGGPRPSAEIRIAPGETVLWRGRPSGSRGRPSYVRVRAPGCYGAQMDGTTFSRVVVFRVAGPS